MLTKESKIESIEIYGEFKFLNVRRIVTVKEKEEIISQTNLRASYDCLTDVDSLDPEIAEIANTVWTEEVKKAYKNYESEMN
tara:strand:+ start:116 stop:361 length:246 start_codon:yes stop_codon:yes gene_type:complete